MKRIAGFSLLILALIACDKTASDNFVDEDKNTEQIVTGRNLNISFTTQAPNGEYAPNHILAVWIEKEDGTFVRSLKVRASERKKYLYTWKASSSSNENDAVTGATISSHKTHDIDWNFLDSDQKAVTNGNYKLKLELTDANAQGPVSTYSFAFTDSVISTQYDDKSSFKDVSITYTQTVQ